MSGVLALGIIYAIFLNKPVTDLLTTGIRRLFSLSENWHLTDYTIMGAMRSTNLQMTDSDLVRITLVCLTYLFVSLLASGYIIENKDF